MKMLNIIFTTVALSFTFIPSSMAESKKGINCEELDNQKICGKGADGKAVLTKDMTGMSASSCKKYNQKDWKGCKCTCESGDLMISWKEYKEIMTNDQKTK